MPALSPRKICLVDGLGALISAFFLGGVLTGLRSWFGMPVSVLRILALLALGLAAHAFYRYPRQPERADVSLRWLARLNLGYCLLSFAIVINYWSLLRVADLVYFFGEIIIVLALSWLEWQTAKRNKPRI